MKQNKKIYKTLNKINERKNKKKKFKYVFLEPKKKIEMKLEKLIYKSGSNSGAWSSRMSWSIDASYTLKFDMHPVSVLGWSGMWALNFGGAGGDVW